MYPDPFPDELRGLLQPGKKLRLRDPQKWNELSDSPLLHILAIVDDAYIVYKTWGRRRWCYAVEWSYWFWLLWRDGDIVVTEPSHGR